MNDTFGAPTDRRPDDQRPARVPAFNLPASLTASIGLLVAIFAVDELLLSEDMRADLLFYFGFIPGRYSIPLSVQGLEWLWSPVTYSLLHGSVTHLAFNCLWLAAFGAPVVRRIGAVRFVAFWVLSSVASAALYAGLHWGEVAVMVGASGVISALMGAACRFAFPERGRIGGSAAVHLLPRLSLGEALKSRTVRTFVGFWFLGNLLFAFGLPMLGQGDAQVAWEAHIGGFLFGFLLFSLFDPIRKA